jgi:hypothetical protein
LDLNHPRVNPRPKSGLIVHRLRSSLRPDYGLPTISSDCFSCVPDLKLRHFSHSVAPTLSALPSISLIPFAPFLIIHLVREKTKTDRMMAGDCF